MIALESDLRIRDEQSRASGSKIRGPSGAFGGSSSHARGRVLTQQDGVYISECPSIPGCVSQGRTEAEAESNIVDAIRECLAVRAELGMPLTVTTREVEVMV